MNLELDECYILDDTYTNKQDLTSKLDKLVKQNKIIYNLEDDLLYIEDLELDQTEIEKLLDFFEENSISPYWEDLDYDDDNLEDDDF